MKLERGGSGSKCGGTGEQIRIVHDGAVLSQVAEEFSADRQKALDYQNDLIRFIVWVNRSTTNRPTSRPVP